MLKTFQAGRQAFCAFSAAIEVYGSDWALYEGSDETQIPFLCSVASFADGIIQQRSSTKIGTNSSLASSATVTVTATWPTPTPSAWESTVKTANKALVTLQWLDCIFDESWGQPVLRLIQALWQLLHSLLLGHVPDHALALELDLNGLLWSSLRNLHSLEMQGYQPFEELFCAVMRRMATDNTLHFCDQSLPDHLKLQENVTMTRFLTLWAILGKPLLVLTGIGSRLNFMRFIILITPCSITEPFKLICIQHLTVLSVCKIKSF